MKTVKAILTIEVEGEFSESFISSAQDTDDDAADWKFMQLRIDRVSKMAKRYFQSDLPYQLLGEAVEKSKKSTKPESMKLSGSVDIENQLEALAYIEALKAFGALNIEYPVHATNYSTVEYKVKEAHNQAINVIRSLKAIREAGYLTVSLSEESK